MNKKDKEIKVNPEMIISTSTGNYKVKIRLVPLHFTKKESWDRTEGIKNAQSTTS